MDRPLTASRRLACHCFPILHPFHVSWAFYAHTTKRAFSFQAGRLWLLRGTKATIPRKDLSCHARILVKPSSHDQNRHAIRNKSPCRAPRTFLYLDATGDMTCGYVQPYWFPPNPNLSISGNTDFKSIRTTNPCVPTGLASGPKGA